MSYMKRMIEQMTEQMAGIDASRVRPTPEEVLTKFNEYPETGHPKWTYGLSKEEGVATCESDKPEGTRDVEKYLREQQDALWRND